MLKIIFVMYITIMDMAITEKQFTTIEGLFNYYNVELFNGQLKDCLLNLSRKNGAMGFFAPRRWKDKTGKQIIHEISINPDTFNVDDEELHRTLVHEMCHLWQEDFGKPSRRCYHNREWSNKMISVGLMPSHNGQPGGRVTGQSMNDYTIEGGRFQQKYQDIVSSGTDDLKLPYYPAKPLLVSAVAILAGETETGEESGEEGESAPSASGKKVRYMCDCETKVWGKPGLNILCGDCGQPFSAT